MVEMLDRWMLGWIALLVFGPVFLVGQPANHTAHKQTQAHMGNHKQQSTYKGSHAPRYVWKDPRIKLSALPPLLGKQMGTVETPGIPPLGYEMDNGVKVFRLIAQPIEQVITDGIVKHEGLIRAMKSMYGAHPMKVHQKVRAWGYNGSTPGPTIEITEGEKVRIIFKNELPEPTTVHWHGIELPFAQDGSSDADPVMPGKTHTYEFTPYQSGTYLYHSGFNIFKQEMSGLVGMLVIHPKAGYEEKIDRDIAIMLQEWALLPGNVYPNIFTTEFNWFTFNGHSAPSIPIITINQDERVRIRLGNMVMDSHPIHIHGFVWDVVGTEGGPIKKSAQWKATTIHVPSGGTRDVAFVAFNPGSWPFHCHKMHHVMNAHAQVPMGIMHHGGMFTFVNVIPKNPNKPWQHPSQSRPDNPDVDAYGYPKKDESKKDDEKVKKQTDAGEQELPEERTHAHH